jgi:hypothetical protein
MLCRSYQLTIKPEVKGREVVLVQGDGFGRMPMATSGAFLFQIKQTREDTWIVFTQEPTWHVRLDMVVSCEPKYGFLKIGETPRLEKAITRDGVELKDSGKSMETLTRVKWATMNPFFRQIPARPGIQSFETVSGSLWAVVESESEDWVIEDLATAAGKTRNISDLIELKITSCQNTGKGYGNLWMEISRKGDLQEYLLNREDLLGRIRYEKDGRALEMEMTSLDLLNGESKTKKCCFVTKLKVDGEGKEIWPDKVVIRVPKEIKAVAAGFEFRNVTMP